MLHKSTLLGASSHALADFLEELERDGELTRIAAEVDPRLEIAAITARVAGEGGPALFFERVSGHDLPVLTNLWGTQARICRALGISTLDALVDRLHASALGQNGNWAARLSGRTGASETARTANVKLAKGGVCQQVVRLSSDVELAQLPALHSWPLEKHPTITAGQVFTRAPDGADSSVASHPLVILGANRLGVYWHEYTAGHAHFEQCRQRGQRMPLAVALGGDPALACLAMATLPSETDALALAAQLRPRPVEVVKCRTNELTVPADADIVIEGNIDPAEPLVAVGPLAGTCGYYLPPRESPVMHVTAVTHRTNPVFVAMVNGLPPHEASELVKITERLLLPRLQAAIPELVDLCLPGRAGLHNFAVVSIRKRHAQQAHKVASAIWGTSDLMHTKFVVVVDEHVDVHCHQQVLRAIGANVHPGRDVFFHNGPRHPLDHAAASILVGDAIAASANGGRATGAGAMGIDATAKLPQEHAGLRASLTESGPETIELLQRRWAEYGMSDPTPAQ